MSIYKRKSGRYAVLIDADDSHPFRIVEPSPPMKNGRRRVKVVREFRTEPEASKELTRLAKAGDARALSIERLARGRRTLGTFATKKEAERAEREALTARDRGFDVAPANSTLGDLFEKYVADAEARGASGTTIRGYREIWKRCAPIAAVPVKNLKPVQLAELYANLARVGWSGGRGRCPLGRFATRTR